MILKVHIGNFDYCVKQYIKPLSPSAINAPAIVRKNSPFFGYIINDKTLSDEQFKELTKFTNSQLEFIFHDSLDIHTFNAILTKDVQHETFNINECQ